MVKNEIEQWNPPKAQNGQKRSSTLNPKMVKNAIALNYKPESGSQSTRAGNARAQARAHH